MMNLLPLSAETDLRTATEVRTGSAHQISGRFAPKMWKVVMILWYNKTSIAGPSLQQHADIGIAA